MASIKKQLMLLKIETVYGTDPVPAGANALLVEGLEIMPLEMTAVAPDYALAGFSKEKSVPAELQAKVKFSADFVPSGVADTPPAYGPALRACGMAEGITAGVSVAYTPISEGFEGVTIYAFAGDTRHKIVGARGTVSLDCQAGKPPKLNFEMTGTFADPGDVALPTPTYAGLLPAKPVSKAATAFTANGVQLVLNAFSLNLGNTVVFRDRPNYQSVDIDDRSIAGSFSVHQPALAAFNAFALATAPTTFVTELTHTVAAGHAAKATVAVTQISKPSYGGDGNQRLVVCPFDARRNAGGADLTFLFN